LLIGVGVQPDEGTTGFEDPVRVRREGVRADLLSAFDLADVGVRELDFARERPQRQPALLAHATYSLTEALHAVAPPTGWADVR